MALEMIKPYRRYSNKNPDGVLLVVKAGRHMTLKAEWEIGENVLAEAGLKAGDHYVDVYTDTHAGVAVFTKGDSYKVRKARAGEGGLVVTPAAPVGFKGNRVDVVVIDVREGEIKLGYDL